MFKKVILTVIFGVAVCSCAFAVVSPASGIATPNGAYVYIPDQTASHIYVVRTSDNTVVQTVDALGLQPQSMAVTPKGDHLFVVEPQPSNVTRVVSYSIDPLTGNLTYMTRKSLAGANLTSGRQCAISVAGHYLFVTNFDNDPTNGGRVYIVDVRTPDTTLNIVGSFAVSSYLWGIAIKPDGTRLYVGSRNSPSNAAIYVYDTSRANLTNPVPRTTILLDNGIDPTYLSVNTQGDELFVRVLQTTSPYSDVLMYNTTENMFTGALANPNPVSIYKILGNDPAYRSSLPGDHTNTGKDIDTNNGFEGMTLSPNGWYMYFSHYDGASGNAMSHWWDTLYGTSVANIKGGFDRTNTSDIWTQWGGYTATGYSGWHSTDGLIATRTNKVYFTYSDGNQVTHEVYLSTPTTPDANAMPMAPEILVPTPETVVLIPQSTVYWNKAVDDGQIQPSPSYEVDVIPALQLESGQNTWQVSSYPTDGATSAVIYGCMNNTLYYLRMNAYDGEKNGAYSYTGPFMAFPIPGWISHYLIASQEVVVDWQDVGTTEYEVQYRVQSPPSAWTSVPVVGPPWYNTTDLNPNVHLTGLTQQTTYEVQVRVAGGAWSRSHYLYTLETPWLDVSSTTTTDAHIIWGPPVSVTTNEIPLADHYVIRWHKLDDPTWPIANVLIKPNYCFEDPTLTALNCSIEGLQENTTYEAVIKTVDIYGLSDSYRDHSFPPNSDDTPPNYWSNVVTFETLPSLRIGHYDVSTDEAKLYWIPSVPGVDHYILKYKKLIDAGWTQYTAKTLTNSLYEYGGTNNNFLFRGNTPPIPPALTIFTTYEVQIQGVNALGVAVTSPSNIDMFFTMRGPRWISNYSTQPYNSPITWEGVPIPAIYMPATYEVSYALTGDAVGTIYDPTPTTENFGQLGVGTYPPLINRTWYYMKAAAYYGGYKSEYSPIHGFYTIPEPLNLICTGTTANTADISWEPVDMGGGVMCSSYEVTWGTTTDVTLLTNIQITPTTNIHLTGLSPNTFYYAFARACDVDATHNGTSEWSDNVEYDTTDEAIIFPPPDPIQGYRGTTVILSGQNLGMVTGLVSFENGGTIANGQPGYWKPNEIAVAVPPNAAIGVNTIVVTTSSGKVAVNVPSIPCNITVTDEAVVLDDFEGGAWEFVTWDAGAMSETKDYAAPPERNTYVTVETQSGAGNYQIFGGVSPYGDQTTESGVSLAGYNKIHLRMKNYGATTLVATFELVESNTVGGNGTGNPNDVEIYYYTVPITLDADGLWHDVTLNLTTEGTASFELFTGWLSHVHNQALDLQGIKAFEIETNFSSSNKFAVDYVVATKEGGASKKYRIGYIDETNSENWIGVPFSNTGITDTLQLAKSIGQPPTMTPQDGDIMKISVRNNATQSNTQVWHGYDTASGGWIIIDPAMPINPGDAISIIISNPGRPGINGTWEVSGDPIPVGGGGKQFGIRYIDETNSENWTIPLDNISGITDTLQLAKSIGKPPTMTPQDGDIMKITVRNNATQQNTQVWHGYDTASGGWIIIDPAMPISTDDFILVVISDPGRPTSNGLWP